MSRRILRCDRTACSARAMVFAAALAAIGCAGGERPDVLLITLDTTRADRLGAYGDRLAQTPAIDAPAAEGFLFARHLTPVPITLPAHTSIFTGLTPAAHGVRDNGTFVAGPELLTLAEVFHQAGYATSAHVGAFPVDSRFGLDQGFELYDDDLPAEGPGGAGVYFPERPAAEVIRRARDWQTSEEADRPRFTWIHLFDPHQPQLPPRPWDLRFAADGYRGEIAAVDEELGRLFAALKAEGRWERTVVALTADHGEGLGEHGELTHAILLHQATLHVPLILRGPGVPRGRTAAWTSSTQLFDTLTALAGVAAPADRRRGRSLVPLLASGGARPAGWPPFEAYFETVAPRSSLGLAQLTAWMKEDWRLVHGPRPGLFDLARDPRELDDRFAAEPVRADALFDRLAGYLAAEEQQTVAASAREVDAETRARLEALGYLRAGEGGGLAALSDLLEVAGLPDPRALAAEISVFSEAKSAMARGDWTRAEGLWQQVLEGSAYNESAQQGLAMISALRGDLPGAIARLKSALATSPAEPTRRLLGMLLFEVGDPAGAVEVLRSLPPSAHLDAWIGRAEAARGDLAAAERAYRAGLEREPDHRFLRLYLGNLLARLGRREEARATLEALVRRHPWFGLGWYNLAAVVYSLGDPAAARPLAERAVALQPSHAPSRELLARLAAEEGG